MSKVVKLYSTASDRLEEYIRAIHAIKGEAVEILSLVVLKDGAGYSTITTADSADLYALGAAYFQNAFNSLISFEEV